MAPPVTGLVLLGADADIARLGPTMAKRASVIDRLGWDRWISESWRQSLPFSAKSVRDTPEIVAEYELMLRSHSAESYKAMCAVIGSTPALSSAVTGLSIPILVGVGADDDRTPPESSRELRELLPASRLEVIPDVGHTLPLEAPEMVAAWVASAAARKRQDDGAKASPTAVGGWSSGG
jgi:pimeloyl-ACP methyl ester carboxylesterase